MGEETKTFTAEELESAIQQRLERDRIAHEKKQAEAKKQAPEEPTYKERYEEYSAKLDEEKQKGAFQQILTDEYIHRSKQIEILAYADKVGIADEETFLETVRFFQSHTDTSRQLEPMPYAGKRRKAEPSRIMRFFN